VESLGPYILSYGAFYSVAATRENAEATNTAVRKSDYFIGFASKAYEKLSFMRMSVDDHYNHPAAYIR